MRDPDSQNKGKSNWGRHLIMTSDLQVYVHTPCHIHYTTYMQCTHKSMLSEDFYKCQVSRVIAGCILSTLVLYPYVRPAFHHSDHILTPIWYPWGASSFLSRLCILINHHTKSRLSASMTFELEHYGLDWIMQTCSAAKSSLQACGYNPVTQQRPSWLTASPAFHMYLCSTPCKNFSKI